MNRSAYKVLMQRLVYFYGMILIVAAVNFLLCNLVLLPIEFMLGSLDFAEHTFFVLMRRL
jgi:hypothetical protein